MTFELCADLVAREIATMFRFTINRNNHNSTNNTY